MTTGSLDIACYERKGGVLRRTAELLDLKTCDAPLGEMLKKCTPLQGPSPEKYAIQCFAGNFQGQSIDLRQTPQQVDYIRDALKNDTKPVLFVIKDLDAAHHRAKSECIEGEAIEEEEEEEEGEGDDEDSLLEGSMAVGDVIAEFLRNGFSTTGTFDRGSWCEDPATNATPPAKREETFFTLVTYDAEPTSTPSRRPLARSVTANAFDSRSGCRTPDMLEGAGEEEGEEGECSHMSLSSQMVSAAHNRELLASGVGSSATLSRKGSYFTKGWKSKTLFLNKSTDDNLGPQISHISGPLNSVYVSGAQPWKRKTGIRRKRKISTVIPVIPEVSYTMEVTSITVETEKGAALKIPCREYSTVGDIKEAITKQLNSQDSIHSSTNYWKPSDVVLLYTLEGKQYELFSEWQFFFMTAVYQSWVRSGQTTPLMARWAHRDSEKDLPVLFRLSRLAGVVMDPRLTVLSEADLSDMAKVAPADMKEVQWARKMLHSFIDQTVASRDPEEYALSVEVESALASTVLALKVPIDNKIDVSFYYKQQFIITKKIGVLEYPDSIMKDLLPSLVTSGLIKDSIDNYTLQVCGERSFIAGKHEFVTFKDIRRCIVKGEPICLSVTEKPSQDMDKPSQLSWCPVDPLSTVTPLHLDIAKKGAPAHVTETVSVWDREDELNLRIITVDNLPPVPAKYKGTLTIQATLYHGGKKLSETMRTTASHVDTSIRWKETLNFRKAKKDIPKAAKVMVVLHETLGRKDSLSGKKPPQFLYWGLINVFDYQGMLQNGEKTMSLWRGALPDSRKSSNTSSGGGDEGEVFEINPSGPATNNPDPKAITMTVRFESYSFPIFYPSCSPQSRASLMESSKADSFVQKHFQKVLDHINQGNLHSAVPTYIAKANWGTLYGSLEVYSLLDRLMEAKDSFPVATALRLLDCDFPDENVRAYATAVLERVPNEQLEDFLLQLTQALKFELNHDSALARFLLKRALNNKRIGHFFFWYLKCEMYNPQYRNRFSVVLEAYLRGCGEDMLVKFEHQVELQTKLEAIGKTLKQLCNDDHGKMQAMLPELLEANRLTHFVTTAVYNPRLQLGNLCPAKCKIMASKKKPQWLEMSNVDPTALVHTPTRLILKLGDDLRQDMITLRMFSLFEKFWEVDGLDLELIPYGCIATGPNTGYIEVVNAKTIAEVSGVSNSTKLYDWIRSHQKNEMGEIDEVKVRTAIRKFIHSCAGYSVATYVLGIGDRHNDNVMVTTSGNLFHIDFGHFLGNIKYCMGFKREWAPFVLTPDFVYVMGGEDSETFEMYKNLCCRAFLTLRRHADIIINLFSMMRSTGIPELTCVEDTDYIKKALLLQKSEVQAEDVFRGIIKKCLDLKWTVQVMWKIHLLRKKGSS